MSLARVLLTVALLVVWYGCSGGGSSGPATQNDQWPKFRHDLFNTGSQPTGSVENIATTFKAVQVDAGEASAISASPAITLDGSVYIASEGGTLLATDASLNIKWRATSCVPQPPATPTIPASCHLCPGPGLGRLVSSPAVYTQNGLATVVVASTSGCLFAFQDIGTTASCTACFRPMDLDPSITDASFVSSPTIIFHPVTLDLTGIFIGATIQRQGPQEGKFYAVNSDGSLKWEFPHTGGIPATIGAITSSPALGGGGSFLFTTDDGGLFSLTSDGVLRWRLDIPSPTNLSLPFAPSPLSANLVYLNTTSGGILAIAPDGTTTTWRASVPNEAFAASLALGSQTILTPTPELPGVPTPTPPTGPGTPTPTPTPLLPESTIYGLTKSGVLVVIDALTGLLIPPSGALPTPVSGSVVSSPALSADLFLLFGTGNGMLYSVNSASGGGPPNWPLKLTAGAAIRSSPAISFNGVIYVGADDGKLYAVGIQ